MPAHAQRPATLRGTVLTDSTERPIRGAEVTIPNHKLSTVSDSAGNFYLGGVPAGPQTIIVRRIGFGSITAQLTFVPGGTIDSDFLLVSLPQALPAVRVTADSARASSRLFDFERRRAAGFGHFLTRADLEKMENRRMAEIVQTLPGPSVLRSTSGGSAWIAGGRGVQSISGGFKVDASDRRRGAPRDMCWSAVVLDGVQVFGANPGEQLFDINSILPSNIEGIEYYSGSATVPPEYNVTRGTCGLLVVWTR